MVRIAKVKFTFGGNLLNYICKDKKIKEGDVVFVEGKDQPVYVYEITEVEDKDSTATKKVLCIAKENPDVNLATRYMNIIDCKCECIVNSLGTETSVFGAICHSIVENAKSKEIDNMLRFHKKENVFWTYITDAGELPSKHVIHIVMPFKDEDEHNKNLRKAFETVIDLAIENGYESLAIPFIGTGANGYSKSDVHEALDDTMFKYQYKQGIKINIVSINYSSTKMQRYRLNQETIARELGYYPNRDNRYDNMFSDFKARIRQEDLYFDIYDEPRFQIHTVNALISKFYKKEDEFDIFNVEKPFDFVLLYRVKKGYKETARVTYVFGTYEGYQKHEIKGKKITTKYTDTVKNIKKGKHTVTKYEVYRIAIALKLNFTQTIQLMTLYGYSFNPISEENIDYEVFNFMINNNGFAKENCDPEGYFFDVDEVVHDLIFGSNERIF